MTTAIIPIDGKSYVLIRSSDVIQAESVKGTKYWQGHVVSDGEKFYTCSSAWHTIAGGLSKVMWSKPYYAVPTNVGQSNERGNVAQAHFEFDSMVKKQQDKRESEKPLPMLAHGYEDRRHKLAYPCAVQPKFDGQRCLYDGEEAWSRGNKPILPEVFAHLHFETQNLIIDGELILPGSRKINETMSAAKKFRKGVSDRLLYRVYDLVIPTMPFFDRFAALKGIVERCGNPNILLAETNIAEAHEDVLRHHARFTEEGFEGTIVRALSGLYAVNKRSGDLLKHKDFVDGEFEIVDVVAAGGGSSEDVGKFVCVNADGQRFESTATGSIEERREYLRNKSAYIGRFAKVKYRELSGANSVPFHSNVLEIRDTRDGGH